MYVFSQVERIPETASDISPYATSNLQTLPIGGNNRTLARTETATGRNTLQGRTETTGRNTLGWNDIQI